jgi:hypothetical protein
MYQLGYTGRRRRNRQNWLRTDSPCPDRSYRRCRDFRRHKPEPLRHRSPLRNGPLACTPFRPSIPPRSTSCGSSHLHPGRCPRCRDFHRHKFLHPAGHCSRRRSRCRLRRQESVHRSRLSLPRCRYATPHTRRARFPRHTVWQEPIGRLDPCTRRISYRLRTESSRRH